MLKRGRYKAISHKQVYTSEGRKGLQRVLSRVWRWRMIRDVISYRALGDDT